MKKKTVPGDFAVNRKAFHDYTVLEKLECGIELSGTEVKVIRHGEASLAGAYASVLGGQLYVEQMHIPVYTFGNRFNHVPLQRRRLLAHSKEIEALRLKSEAKGLTLIPLRLYLKRGRVKLELGVCRGKSQVDKRETIRRRDADLEARRAMRAR